MEHYLIQALGILSCIYFALRLWSKYKQPQDHEVETMLDIVLPLMVDGTREERKREARRRGFLWWQWRQLEYQAAQIVKKAADRADKIGMDAAIKELAGDDFDKQL